MMSRRGRESFGGRTGLRRLMAVAVCVGMLMGMGRQGEAAGIPLAMDFAPDVAFPVSSGIPFPRGALKSLDHLKLVDKAGKEVPAQFSSLALWPDESQKAVLVTFVAAPKVSAYVLLYGDGVARGTYATGLSVVESPARVEITSGPVRLSLNKSGFTLFEQAWVDRNENGRFEADEMVIAKGGEIFLVNAFNKAEYSSARFSGVNYLIEERGPLRAVVKVTGKLQAADGDRLTDFIVRISAYAGMGVVRMDYTLVDTREEKDVEAKRDKLALSVSGYGLRLSVGMAEPRYAFGGENGKIYEGRVEGEQYLYQSGRLNHRDGALEPFDFAFEGAGKGKKASGWMDVGDSQTGVSVMVQNFWQQFPKELAVQDRQLTVYLHPMRASLPLPDLQYPPLDSVSKRYVRPNTLYAPREGMAKTYRMLFHFHKGNGAKSGSEAVNTVFQHPPLLTAPAEWYGKSGAFGDLLPAGPWSKGYDTHLMENIYRPSIENKKETGGLAVVYGWRDFGDRMRPGWAAVSPGGVRIPGFYNDTHVGAAKFFTEYLRTRDRRWWNLGEVATRHFMDIDVSHTHRLGYWRDRRTARRPSVSFGPGEAHVISHEMVDHASRSLHGGHAHLSGLPDYYLLTGDRRALEVLREVGDWWVNAAPVVFPTPVEKPHLAEAERDFGWPLFVLNEAFRATGDVRYLRGSAQIVKHLIEWWQTPSDHWVNGTVVGRNDSAQGTGWWHMFPRQDNSPFPSKWMLGQLLYNGTNPWMAGSLLSAVATFYQLNQDFKLADNSIVKDMYLQTVNYVVKWGWKEQSPKECRPPQTRYFIYSEAVPCVNGGKNQLLFPLAFAWTLYQEGGHAHPEWYDTVPQWLEIVKATFEDWKEVKYRDDGTVSTGFYGYEMVFPPDFWAIAQRLQGRSPHSTDGVTKKP